MEKNTLGYSFKSFDRIRALACILVCIQHFCTVICVPFFKDMPNLLRYGTSGVFLFFVMSGFLITLAVKDTFKDDGSQNYLQRLCAHKVELKKFYIKRFYRIVPPVLFILSIMMLFLFFWMGIEQTGLWFNEFMRNTIEVFYGIGMYDVIEGSVPGMHFVFSYGIAPLWTIGIDLTFYLLWPLVLSIVTKHHHRVALCFWGGILGIFIVEPLLVKNSTSFYYYSHLANFGTFLFGSLLALLYDGKKSGNVDSKNLEGDELKKKLEKGFNQKVSKKCCCFCILPILFFLILWIYPAFYSNVRIFYYRIIPEISSVLLIFFAIYNDNLFNLPGIGKILDCIGARSFSIYITSSFVANFVMCVFGDVFSKRDLGDSYEFVQACVIIVLLLALSEIFYRFIEIRYRNRGREIANGILD